MSRTDMLLLIGLFLLLIFYAWAAQKLCYVICGSQKRTPVSFRTVYSAAAALPVLAMCRVWIPLPGFYLLFYAAGCLPLLAEKEKDSRKWIFMNVRFLTFAAPHLIVVGMLALCLPADVTGVLSNFTLRTLSLVIVTLLNALLFSVLANLVSVHQNSLHWDSEEMQLFSGFVWFCASSVVFDSIPCMFSLPTIFHRIYLIGSNLLLLLMVFLFARHVYTIMRDSWMKEQAIRLREEAMEQHSRTVRLEQTAYLDTLTGIYTRMYAIENMSSMLSSAEKFILVFLDLDGLKQINDKQGHTAGDAYLKKFAACMKKKLRNNDIFVRYGGDEFLILMPALTVKSADSKMQCIQTEASLAPPEGWGIPFSYGLVPAWPDEGKRAKEWIAMADNAMYHDKLRRKQKREGGQK